MSEQTVDRRPPVAFLVKRFPRLSETFVLNEFLELRRQGVPLRLVALMDPAERHRQPEADALVPEVTYLRGGSWWPLTFRLLRVAARHRRGTASALAWVISRRRLASWRRLGEALVLVDILEGEPVHLHVHWAHAPAGTALLAHRIAGIPWSLTTHAKDLYTMPIADIAERCAQATFVATCTAANAAYLTEVVGVDPGKVILCRHGVRFDRFDAGARAAQPGRLLAVGRLVPKKGLDVLIDACALLHARGVEFTLDVIGDGPSGRALATQVATCGLGARVTFHGARPQPDLVEFYRRASVFALAPTVQADGDRDGVPNVILEAMACAVPVVASRISGIPEVIDDGRTGVLVPPGDATALADALEKLLRCPAVADDLGRAAAEAVRAKFEIETCVAPITELLTLQLAAVGTPVESTV